VGGDPQAQTVLANLSLCSGGCVVERSLRVHLISLKYAQMSAPVAFEIFMWMSYQVSRRIISKSRKLQVWTPFSGGY
jgi:hypothetical protein